MKIDIKDIKDFAKQFGIVHTIAVIILVIAVGFTIAIASFKSDSSKLFCLKVATALVIVALFVEIFTYSFFRIFIKGNIKVIAWSGWRNKELNKYLDKANFLTYEGQPETMPDLKYDGEEFDVFVTDLLYLNEYCKEDRLVDLSNFNDLCNLHHDFVTKRTNSPCRKKTKRIGIPIEFGFSELLINKDWFLGNDHTSSKGNRFKKLRENFIKKLKDNEESTNEFFYNDFELRNLLKYFPNIKIGIWDWYIPALFHLLLIDKKQDEDISLKNLANQPKDRVEAATRIILEKHKNFRILHDLNIIKDVIRDKDIGLIIGSGSSALSNKDDNSGYVPIIPKEGVLMWVNCLTVINKAGAGAEKARPLIEHWNSEEIQKILANKESYRSCPVSDVELEKIIGGKHPSAKTLTKYLVNKSPNITLRKIPKYAGEWQIIWDGIRKRIRSY